MVKLVDSPIASRIAVFVLLICLAIAIMSAFANVISRQRRINDGSGYSCENALADWSLTLGLIACTIFALNHEKFLSLGIIGTVVFAFWPLLTLYWWQHRDSWTLATVDPTARGGKSGKYEK